MSLSCNVNKIRVTSKIGIIEISDCIRGVHSVNILPEKENIGVDFDINDLPDEEEQFSKHTMISWLKAYFTTPLDCLKMTSPPICPTVFLGKGAFTKKVWTTLMSNATIGKTLSYGELAKLCGNSAASRAVGSAMKNNPIPLLIPCHRVVKSDGSIGSFSCGVHVKEWLLNHENNIAD